MFPLTIIALEPYSSAIFKFRDLIRKITEKYFHTTYETQ
jgi:hypothetical protein